MIESQLNYVIDCLKVMRDRGADVVDVRQEAQGRFNNEIAGALRGTVWTAEHCQSWYLDSTGRNTTIWPDASFRFRSRTRRFEQEKYVLAAR